jgi:nitrogen-specific signal transduction histidine kinase/ActR/RegA family two-component response regulator
MLTETNAQLAQALKAVRQKEQELVQHERLRALGQMASGVAHDFNNALQPILLSAGMVLEDPSKQTPARMKKYMQEILVAARDAAATVKRLVRFYRPPVTDGLGSVNLAELFNEVIALTRPKWRDEALSNGCTIRIRTDVDNSLTVSGQADELREVFINLVFNAITAIHGTGEIFLKARRQEFGGISITVQDTGMGMPEDIRAQCFEPFVTTKQDQGAGLGLAIVYGIIQRQGGTISVDSKPRHGTVFSIYLPEGADRVAEPKVTQSAGVMPTGRILVVEDELEVCNLLAGTLRHEGFTVTTAIDGRQGWELFQQKRFDLVLTDQALPEMPGDRLAARIKEMDPQTPVIMLTGYGGMMRARGHVPVHIDQLLDKPVSTEKLRQAIKALLERGPGAKEPSA